MIVYRENKLAEVRPDSTFANFEIQNPDQEKAVGLLKRIADQIIGKAPAIVNETHPFANGKIIFLWSEPGHGKTHLIEALINEIRTKAPDVLKRMVLSRGRFYYDFQTMDAPYGDVPIVIIDDMFREHSKVADLHPATELQAMMKFITSIYDRRMLAIVTSNFPMLAKDGILSRLEKVDPVGRTLSRAKELFAQSGEIYLQGEDFRPILAKRRGDDPFAL